MRFLPQSIAGRLTLWFLLIALIPSAIAIVTMFMIFRTAAEKTIQEQIQLVLKERMSDLNTFLHERGREADLLANAPGLISVLERLREAQAKDNEAKKSIPTEIYDAIRDVANAYAETLKFDNFLLFYPDGRPLFALRPSPDVRENLLTGPLSASGLGKAVANALQTNSLTTSMADQYPGFVDQRFLIFQAKPVRAKDGQVLAVLAIQLNQDEFEMVFEDYSGLGETGDVYSGKLTQNNEVKVTARYRNQTSEESASNTFRLGDTKGEALQEAVQKREGYGIRNNYRGVESVAAWAYQPVLDLGVVVVRDKEEAYGVLSRFRWVSLGLMAMTALLVVPPALIAARSISRPIQESSEIASRVAAGDLTREIKVEGLTGEIGRLMNSLRNMNGQLRSLIGHVQHSIVAVMSACTEITATARTQQRTADDLGVAASEVSAAVNQISATSQELLGTMSEVRESAKRTADITASGQQSLHGMHQTMTRLADSTSSISSRLSVISERANNINLVVTTITKVADQTNLLSINAAIEAEKAGEYGRGFIVVAREIRRLADQTAMATLDIERIVKEMQHSVAAGVMEMDKFNEQVRQGVGEVVTIGEQLNEVIGSVQELIPRFEQVTEGMSAQSQGAQQIREAMGQLRDGASHTADSLREFQETTEQLRDAVSHLQEDIAKFQT